MTRGARGIELTPAGRVFLDHARSVLSQVETATEAARRITHSGKPCFVMGFLTGHELTWMPEALTVMVILSSDHDLAARQIVRPGI